MDRELSLLILSCDKNHDLYKFINKTCNLFLQRGIDCVVTTESQTDDFCNGIQAYACGYDFDERFVFGLKKCKNDYVLVLLDDYFVHDIELNQKIDEWMTVIRDKDLAALRISKLGKKFVKKSKIKKNYFLLKSIKPYEIDFHPTIWKKSDLLSLIEFRRFSPWSLEPLFALFLKDKKSAITKNTINYSELIIQGRFFRKPFIKYCQHEYEGTKQIITNKKYIIYRFKKMINDYLPYPILNLVRRIFVPNSISRKAKL